MKLGETLKRLIGMAHVHNDSIDIQWTRGENTACIATLNKTITGGGGSITVEGGDNVPAVIRSKSGLYYLCDIFENGVDQAATQTGIPIFVLNLNYAETLPTGTWIIANLNSIGITGGGYVP